jgi:hypothetical protein
MGRSLLLRCTVLTCYSQLDGDLWPRDTPHEKARVHHAAQRRRGVAARGARAAAGQAADDRLYGGQHASADPWGLVKGFNDGRRGVLCSHRIHSGPCPGASRNHFADRGVGPWPIEDFQRSGNDRLFQQTPRFLERLNKLHTQLAEGPIKPFLDTEIEHCRAFLGQPPTFIPHRAEVEVAAPQSPLARFFLAQPAVSVRKRIFKGLFYFFFGIAMIYVPLALILLYPMGVEGVQEVWLIPFSFVFYLIIALLFRRAAR